MRGPLCPAQVHALRHPRLYPGCATLRSAEEISFLAVRNRYQEAVGRHATGREQQRRSECNFTCRAKASRLRSQFKHGSAAAVLAPKIRHSEKMAISISDHTAKWNVSIGTSCELTELVERLQRTSLGAVNRPAGAITDPIRCRAENVPGFV